MNHVDVKKIERLKLDPEMKEWRDRLLLREKLKKILD